MWFGIRKVVSAATLGIGVLLVGSCDSDPEITADADFIAFNYQVPEVRYGPIAEQTDGRVQEFWSLITPTGTAVITKILRKDAGGTLGCCYSVRLVNLDDTGAVRSKRDLVAQSAGSNGFKVFPVGADDTTIRLVLVQEKLEQVNPDDRYKTRTRQLWMAGFARDGTEVDRTPALALPNGVVVERAYSRADGATALIGTTPGPDETLGWIGLLGRDGTLNWQRTYSGWTRGQSHAHVFSDPDTLVLEERASRWTDRGADHILSRRTLDLSDGTMSEQSAFTLPRSSLSDTPLGKIRPVVARAVRLPGGDTIISMTGWYRGDFEKLRVARIGADGKIRWINTLIEGPGEMIPALAVGNDSEIVVTGRVDETQYLFRLSLDGVLIAKHPVRKMTIQRIKAHPDGSYLAWAQYDASDRQQRISLMRLKAWPAK